MIRRVIHIDEDKCNGCGACVTACHEGAIGLVDGKARLMRDDYCDGLGDCLPQCPTGAITFIEREAAAYRPHHGGAGGENTKNQNNGKGGAQGVGDFFRQVQNWNGQLRHGLGVEQKSGVHDGDGGHENHNSYDHAVCYILFPLRADAQLRKIRTAGEKV